MRAKDSHELKNQILDLCLASGLKPLQWVEAIRCLDESLTGLIEEQTGGEIYEAEAGEKGKE